MCSIIPKDYASHFEGIDEIVRNQEYGTKYHVKKDDINNDIEDIISSHKDQINVSKEEMEKLKLMIMDLIEYNKDNEVNHDNVQDILKRRMKI